MINIKKTRTLPIVLCTMLSLPLFAKDNNITVVNDSENPVPVLIGNNSTNPSSVIIENTSPLEVVVKKTMIEKKPYSALARCFDQTDTFKYCFVSTPPNTYFEVKNISGNTSTANVISMFIAQNNNIGKARYFAPSLTVSIPQARNSFTTDEFYIIEYNRLYTAPDGKQYDARLILETDKHHNGTLVHFHGWLHTVQ